VRRFAGAEVATLRAIGQQVGLLLRVSRLLAEARQQRAEAEAAEARYHNLLDRVPAGVWRTNQAGHILDVNPPGASRRSSPTWGGSPGSRCTPNTPPMLDIRKSSPSDPG